MVTLFIVGYLVSVFLSYGIVLGYTQAINSAINAYNDHKVAHRIVALFLSLAGPISLILFYFVTNGARFGLRFW